MEAILARSEQVMGICQGILNGEMITPTYRPLSPASSLPCLAEPALEEPALLQVTSTFSHLPDLPFIGPN